MCRILQECSRLRPPLHGSSHDASCSAERGASRTCTANSAVVVKTRGLAADYRSQAARRCRSDVDSHGSLPRGFRIDCHRRASVVRIDRHHHHHQQQQRPNSLQQRRLQRLAAAKGALGWQTGRRHRRLSVRCEATDWPVPDIGPGRGSTGNNGPLTNHHVTGGNDGFSSSDPSLHQHGDDGSHQLDGRQQKHEKEEGNEDSVVHNGSATTAAAAASAAAAAAAEPRQNGGAAAAAATNGRAAEGLRSQFERIRLRILFALSAIRSVLPYGSWWDIGVKREKGQQEKKKFWSAMSKLWMFASPDKGLLAVSFLFLVLAALSEVAIPHYVAATIFAAANGLKEKFNRSAQVLIVMTLSCGLFSGLRGLCFGIVNMQMVKRMRESLFATIVKQDIAFFDLETVGDLTSRLGSDCQQASSIVSADVNIMLRNALQGICSLAFLIHLSPPIAAVTAAFCAVMWTGLLAYGRFQRVTAMVVQDTVASANEVAEETFSLARVVRTFGTERFQAARYTAPLDRLWQLGLRRSVAYCLWTCSSNTLYNATQVVVLIVGGGLVMQQQISAEQLTKFILYAEWVVHATWWVGDHWSSIMEAIGACQRVFELLDLPPATQLTARGSTLPSLRGSIEFRDVSFCYPTRPSAPVLDSISLTIRPGELIALVGLSGSGKSTLVGLLQRLYEPTSGQILIDGVPLDKLDVFWFRQKLGVVSQEPRLFSTTIAANIAYGNEHEDVSRKRVEAAARAANADGFIRNLPEGYETMVDNARLSGGQKQRIAIARALVRDPSILILDEATSALDAESEHQVQVALDHAMRDTSGNRKRTVLVIAHRLSTIRAADRIVVMQAGRILEVGTHEELLNGNGEYARLNRRQLDTLPA